LQKITEVIPASKHRGVPSWRKSDSRLLAGQLRSSFATLQEIVISDFLCHFTNQLTLLLAE
jgi:hypothetical protein